MLVARQAGEARYIEVVKRNHTSRTALVPWVSELPDYLAWLGLLVSGDYGRANIPQEERVA